MGSSQTGDQTGVPCLGGQILNHWPTRDVPHYDHSCIYLLMHTHTSFCINPGIELLGHKMNLPHRMVCERVNHRKILAVSVQSLSCVRLFATPRTTAHQASLSITNSQTLPKPMSIESVMPSSHLILCCSLLLLSSIFPSIRVFLNESTVRIRWPKDWSFSFNFGPSNEHPELIYFRIDWLDLLAVQGTLKSLLKSISSSVLSFRYSPTLASIHDHWKYHSLD